MKKFDTQRQTSNRAIRLYISNFIIKSFIRGRYKWPNSISRAGNSATVNNSESWGYTAGNIISLDKTVATKHRINFTGLYSIQESHQHNTGITKDSIDQDFVQFYNLGQVSTSRAPVVSGGESSQVLLSYMSRINYKISDSFKK